MAVESQQPGVGDDDDSDDNADEEEESNSLLVRSRDAVLGSAAPAPITSSLESEHSNRSLFRTSSRDNAAVELIGIAEDPSTLSSPSDVDSRDAGSSGPNPEVGVAAAIPAM